MDISFQSFLNQCKDKLMHLIIRQQLLRGLDLNKRKRQRRQKASRCAFLKNIIKRTAEKSLPDSEDLGSQTISFSSFIHYIYLLITVTSYPLSLENSNSLAYRSIIFWHNFRFHKYFSNTYNVRSLNQIVALNNPIFSFSILCFLCNFINPRNKIVAVQLIFQKGQKMKSETQLYIFHFIIIYIYYHMEQDLAG